MRLTVLGPVRAWRGDDEVDLGPVRQRALLAALLLRPGTLVSRQELLDGVWGLEPPGTGASVVPVYVHRLRKCLDAGLIVSDRGGYRFDADGVDLDVTTMEQHAAEAAATARAGDLDAAVGALGRAIDLFDGEPLAGLPGPYAAGQRRRLTERLITLQLRRSEWRLKLGAFEDVIAELGELTETHPHNEPLAVLLMRALHRAGRRADALEVFTRLRDRLARDLGVEPGSEACQAQQEMLGAAPKRGPRNELPAVAGIVGRDRELAVLTADGPAVIAVDGVPGAGKTALVVQAADRIRPGFPDGCLFVDLHGYTEGRPPVRPVAALQRLLRAVGGDDRADDIDELAASWRAATASVKLLLVLDNASSAEQVRPLLPAGPGCRVLVTSRHRLAGLPAGRRISLGALDVRAARDLLRHLAPRPGASEELVRLCGRLPLALCIAGARLQTRPMWTYEQMAERLTGDRLGGLIAEDRSVEAALRLSYDQLPLEQQRVFRVLGLSPTPEFEALAVAAMLGCSSWDAERALENLVDASLVQQPAAGRYRLHDLVAVYAKGLAEPFDATGVLRLFLAAARYASDWGDHPTMSAVPFTGWEDATAWLDATGGSIVDVVRYAADLGEVDYACWIAEGLVEYFMRQARYHECRAALEIAFPLVDRSSDPRMVVALRNGFGIAYGMQGHYETSRTWFTDALEISTRRDDRRSRAQALAGLGTLARAAGRLDESFALLTEVLEIGREIDDKWLSGLAVTNIGELHHAFGRTDEALDCLAQGVCFAEKLGNARAMAMALGSVGTVYLGLGRADEAAAALGRAAELAARVGDLGLEALCLTRLGSATGDRELHHRALALVTEDSRPDLGQEIRARLDA
ncbi:regulatory protein AfsR [Lentzea sp. NBRC 105346]|uniref:AfsR/SARP family transcriptional regulator n=1 Tax=Lentzea sp. NBRC 105346 TaxID=3032205 RepID=UPI0024A32BF1|nr:BTAD domain-containing putative transcriptional regulator [Lentzea sp. NBRC 105346]GLZ31805.1 regulatory protein AfsR [Lentzea sp. NBRC 105346]